MASLSTLEKRKLEDILEMSGGYVLDFSNDRFEEFIRNLTGLSIYNDKYLVYGSSKAKRLRAFWELESDKLVGIVLKELLELWKYNQEKQQKDPFTVQYKGCQAIVYRLTGNPSPQSNELTEDSFLKEDFGAIDWEKINIEPTLIPILKSRVAEAQRCLTSGSHLAAIFMAGSVLEGLLLGIATNNPKEFNLSKCSPKKDEKVKAYHEWSLSEFIDVAYDCNYIGLDVKKFSHALRDFRNFIHPFQQLSTGFNPDKHTSQISFQVLNAALASLSGIRNKS